jgi:hypothetical protein
VICGLGGRDIAAETDKQVNVWEDLDVSGALNNLESLR